MIESKTVNRQESRHQLDDKASPMKIESSTVNPLSINPIPDQMISSESAVPDNAARVAGSATERVMQVKGKTGKPKAAKTTVVEGLTTKLRSVKPKPLKKAAVKVTGTSVPAETEIEARSMMTS